MARFEAGMPLVGLALGAPLGHVAGSAADYIAIGVLFLFGIYTLLLFSDDDEERLGELANMNGWQAGMLGLSISRDELAVGFTLGLLRLPVVPVIIIATQAFVVSQLGTRLSEGARRRRTAGGSGTPRPRVVRLAEKLSAWPSRSWSAGEQALGRVRSARRGYWGGARSLRS